MKKNYIITMLVGLTSVLPAAGTDEGYRPMIREDRTWEYLETHTELNPLTAAETNRNTLFRMKFDGNEEKNGKEYSRFVYCGDRSSWTSTVDYRTGATTSSDMVTVPNEDATVYYLREEPGKVFILFPYEDYVDYSGNGYKVKKGEEVLLYDFTLSEGESFTGFWSYGNFQGGLIDYPVRALDPVKIAGEECRVFGVTDKFMGACRDYRFAEEAGCLNYGTLAAPDAVVRTSGFSSTDCHLQKIYDGDGDVIYDARMAPYTDIVDNGKSWTYNHLDIVASSTYQSLTPGPTYTFGEAETVDQTEYLPLMCDDKRTGMLMRQEGLRVYVRFEKDKAPYIPGYPAGEDYKDRDLLVYDLGASVGDTYHALTVGEGGAFEWVELRVTEAGTLATASGERDFIKVVRNDVEDRRSDTVVDGLGSLSGVFFTADLGPEVTGSGYDKEILYDVTGKEGKVLCKGKPFTTGPDMVAEGRVWEYYSREGGLELYPEQELYRWQFSGTVEKEGKTWNRLMRVGSVKWKGSDPASAVTDDTGTEVALLRQEDNRVWILEDTGERVLYDFNLQPRDETNFSPAYLDVVYEYRLDDIDYKYSAIGASGFYNFTPCGEASGLAPVTYSSNWGNVGRGDMLHIEFEEEADGAPVRCLRNVYDLEGKVLYKGADIEVPPFGGIDGMEAGDEADRSDAHILDMLGRRVTSMARGGIYIRDGKKFVGR